MPYRLFLPLLIVAVISSKPALATEFPEDDWEVGTPEAAGLNLSKLKEWSDYSSLESDDRKTDALLLIRHGKIIFEKYNFGYSKDMRHLSWSMAKSVSAIIFGIAESEGIISRGTKMNELYPDQTRDDEEQTMRDKVTMSSLLTMSSGIEWREDYSKSAPLQSDVTQMLYMNAHRDMGAYTASRPMRFAPGDQFAYSTGNTNVVMASLKFKMPEEKYDQYPWVKLFNKIGMKNVAWEQDDSGTFLGGSYVYATARDYARFGYLLLNNGQWKTEQIVPREWMQFIKKLTPGLVSGSHAPEDSTAYGAGFWLNVPAPQFHLPAAYPTAPADTFMAIGHSGQSIMIIPSQDLLVVRLAHDPVDSGIDRKLYLKLLMESLEDYSGAEQGEASALGIESPDVEEVTVNGAKIDPPVPPRKLTSFVHITQLIASLRAKDFCSCHFVVGQSIEFCKKEVLHGFPLIRMKVDEVNLSDSFGLLPSEGAYFESDQLGCSFN